MSKPQVIHLAATATHHPLTLAFSERPGEEIRLCQGAHCIVLSAHQLAQLNGEYAAYAQRQEKE